MKEGLELRHLRYFLAVAETLHFTRAAERLGMAQPPLSQQIKRLEQMVGHPLFERTTRGVNLTLAGHLLVERARGTLAKVQDDLAQVRRLGRGEEGTLTVGFPGSIMFTALPIAIQSYRKRYPRVELRLQELTTSGQIAGLLDGTIDLAFLRDGDSTDGLAMRTLMKERFVAILPEGHVLAKKATVNLALLAEEPFILFSRRHGALAYDRTIACCEKQGFRPNIVQDAPQWPTVLRLVAAGVGVSLGPACLATVTIPGAVCRSVIGRATTSVDLAVKLGAETALARNFSEIAALHLTQ